MNITTTEDEIRIEAHLPTEPTCTWSLLTERRHIAMWWGDHVDLEPTPGGSFEEVWYDGERQVSTVGEITRFDPPRELAMTWADDDWPAPTMVSVRLSPDNGGTRLIFRHDNWSIHRENNRVKLIEAHASGWSGHLDRLIEYATVQREADDQID